MCARWGEAISKKMLVIEFWHVFSIVFMFSMSASASILFIRLRR